MERLDFVVTRPRLPVQRTKSPPLFQWVGRLADLSAFSRGHFHREKDSIQPQVPLRLPCYDFTPVEDPTVVCANKTTKSLCVTSSTQK